MAEITALTELQQMNLDILRLVQSDTAAAEKAITFVNGSKLNYELFKMCHGPIRRSAKQKKRSTCSLPERDMTTAAWDGKTLASDTQASTGDVVCSLSEQKIYTAPSSGWEVYGDKIVAIGCSGDCGAEMELQELMANGLTYATEFLPTFGFSAIAIIGTGRAYVISKKEGDTRANISLQVEPYAIGSGGLIARAVMRCGKDAREAVQVAIEMDCYSGGNVDSFTIDQLPYIVIGN